MKNAFHTVKTIRRPQKPSGRSSNDLGNLQKFMEASTLGLPVNKFEEYCTLIAESDLDAVMEDIAPALEQYPSVFGDMESLSFDINEDDNPTPIEAIESKNFAKSTHYIKEILSLNLAGQHKELLETMVMAYDITQTPAFRTIAAANHAVQNFTPILRHPEETTKTPNGPSSEDIKRRERRKKIKELNVAATNGLGQSKTLISSINSHIQAQESLTKAIKICVQDGKEQPQLTPINFDSIGAETKNIEVALTQLLFSGIENDNITQASETLYDRLETAQSKLAQLQDLYGKNQLRLETLKKTENLKEHKDSLDAYAEVLQNRNAALTDILDEKVLECEIISKDIETAEEKGTSLSERFTRAVDKLNPAILKSMGIELDANNAVAQERPDIKSFTIASNGFDEEHSSLTPARTGLTALNTAISKLSNSAQDDYEQTILHLADHEVDAISQLLNQIDKLETDHSDLQSDINARIQSNETLEGKLVALSQINGKMEQAIHCADLD